MFSDTGGGETVVTEAPEEVPVEDGSPESPEEEEEDEEEEEEQLPPEELLALGKKCMAAGDAAGAVDHFQEACSILSVLNTLLCASNSVCAVLGLTCMAKLARCWLSPTTSTAGHY